MRATGRAYQHNAKSLCAAFGRNPSRCAPLTRPHNLHYVGMPAAQGNLARWSLRGFFDRESSDKQRAPNEPRPRLPLAARG